MAITSRSPKPNEWASKINHTHIINDPFIKDFIEGCEFPSKSSEITDEDKNKFLDLDENIINPIKFLIAVDGGYTTVEVKKSFPSSQIAFFQFGALLFETKDLDDLSEKPFIFPEDMQKLHNLTRFKLAIPLQNMLSSQQQTLSLSVRKAIYDFFMEPRESTSFMETLSWFIFQGYKNTSKSEYSLASDPNLEIGSGSVLLNKGNMSKDYTFTNDSGTIYLTDAFRLHEAIDDVQGAGGILGYITRLIEQLILVHSIRLIHKKQPSSLSEFLFIADGPLSFSGQTANMNKPMRELCNYLKQEYNLYMVGIEKSGAFVDHAREICSFKDSKRVLEKEKYILLDNRYIYKYIIPGDPDGAAYASTSYYGGKVIYHSGDGQVIVLTIPVSDKNVVLNPVLADYHNIDEILVNIKKLRCDMYDDSIVPIALANKLVSLANHPSKILLEKFSSSLVSKPLSQKQ